MNTDTVLLEKTNKCVDGANTSLNMQSTANACEKAPKAGEPSSKENIQMETDSVDGAHGSENASLFGASSQSKAKTSNAKGKKKSGSTNTTSKTISDQTMHQLFKNIIKDLANSKMFYYSFLRSLPDDEKRSKEFQKKLACIMSSIGNVWEKSYKSPAMPGEKITSADARTHEVREAHKLKRKVKYRVDVASPKYPLLLDVDNEDDILYGDQDWNEGSILGNLYDRDLDKVLGNRIWSVQFEQKSAMNASWEGQILARVNPVLNILKIFMWYFNPDFTEQTAKDMKAKKFTEGLVREMVKLSEAAERSTQCRIDIPLHYITRIDLYAPNGTEKEGALIIESSIKCETYTRHLHKTLVVENMWQRNSGYMVPDNVDTSDPTSICLGGIVSELMEVVAAMMVTDPHIKELYNISTETPHVVSMEAEAGPSGDADPGVSPPKLQKKNSGKRATPRHSKKPVSLPVGNSSLLTKRKGILEILRKHELISESQAEEAIYNLVNARDASHVRCNNLLGSLTFEFNDGGCFFDFVNFECKGANHLEERLALPCKGSDLMSDMDDILEEIEDDEDEEGESSDESNQEESDDDSDEDKKRSRKGHKKKLEPLDFETMTYAEYLRKYSMKFPDSFYLSLCCGELMQSDHDSHCSRCHDCNDWHHWHCTNCNQCTYGQSIPRCDNCKQKDSGIFDDVPLSVYLEHEKALKRDNNAQGGRDSDFGFGGFDDEDFDSDVDSDEEYEKIQEKFQKDPLSHEYPGDRSVYRAKFTRAEFTNQCADVKDFNVKEGYLHRAGILGELGLQVARSINRTSNDPDCMLMKSCAVLDDRDHMLQMMAMMSGRIDGCRLQ